MGEVVVIGGGGHARVLISLLRKLGWAVAGYTDARDRGAIQGAVRLGADDVLAEVAAAHPGYGALVGVGKVDATALRLTLQEDAESRGLAAPVVVSPDAVVNVDVRLGAGTMVFDGAVINCGASAGRACIVNTHATIEHDCVLGDDVHVAPGATVCGDVRIGDHCMIGAGATVVQGIRIAAGSVVGAGAVVVADIEEPGVYTGCPARRTS